MHNPDWKEFPHSRDGPNAPRRGFAPMSPDGAVVYESDPAPADAGGGARMIRGTTGLVAHIGWPTHAFKAPLIYNPYFEHAGIDAVVVPMGCRAEHYPAFLRAVFTLENIRGALVTMPHMASTVALLDEASPAVRIAGACNAVRRL